MRALNQTLELIHPFIFIVSKIWIDIVVIDNGIRRAYIPFDIVLAATVPEYACVPDVGDSQLVQVGQGAGIESGKFAAAP